MRPERIEGVDVARAVAGIVMIQGHAYDGWCSPEAKETAAYALTRLLGSVPLPAFLLLAGASVALRADAARTRAESSRTVRARVALRGLGIVAWGYATNTAFALMDGWDGLHTFLRADVLHVIGLSIAAVAWLGIRPARGAPRAAPPDPRRIGRAALALGVAVTLACPWLSRASPPAHGPLRYVVGLFADVPDVTRMPFVPLAAWLAAGVLAAQWMLRARASEATPSVAGAPRGTLFAMAGVGLAMAAGGSLGTDALLHALGGTLTRAHVAVWTNVVDLAGRGLIVLSAGASLAPLLRGRARAALLLFGRRSLVAYVFHIPVCYGALARPLAGRLDMAEATAALVQLLAASFAAAWSVDRLRARRDR